MNTIIPEILQNYKHKQIKPYLDLFSPHLIWLVHDDLIDVGPPPA